MMAFEPISEEIYDSVATFITYAKIFPYIMTDFATREDAKQMMSKTNLVLKVDPGQVVATTGSPTAQAGSTTSPGTGLALPVYDGSFPSPGSKVLEQAIKAQKEAGGAAVTGLTEVVSAATGG